MTLVTEKKSRRALTRPIPPALVYEQWQGKPIYYRGYQDVLAGTKTLEEIMSCSDIQGVLISLIIGYVGANINRKKHVLSINSGLQLALNDNLCNDVVIFEKEKLVKLQGKYFDVAPKIVIDRNDPTWYVVNWSENITVLENCTLNIKQLLDDEAIAY